MPVRSPDHIQTRPKRSLLWNLLTVLTLLASLCLVLYFAALFDNPRFFLNPFPPLPSVTVEVSLTPTITPIQQPSTWTPTITIKPTASRTLARTWTRLPGMETLTSTLTPSVTLTLTLEGTEAPAGAEITYHPRSEFYPDKGCDWMGVGGSVHSEDGTPLLFQTVQLGGALGEVVMSQVELSGSAPAFGTAGFEFDLSARPVASTHTLWIQVFDNTGKALTDKTFFDTFDDCSRNLIRIIFTRTR